MHIRDILAGGKTTISFEFFPPKQPEATTRLMDALSTLESFAPHFVSVTYGAGGSTRDLTHDLVVRLRTTTSLEPIAHLTCVGHSREDIAQILERYATAGVRNLLALRGDNPVNGSAPCGDFPHASELVSTIRGFAHPADSRGFGIGVAGFPEGHPATPNRLLELDHLKAKVDAGADYICTQLFFDNHDFYDFRERCDLAGIRVPIIAGIMPVTNLAGLRRIAELAAGARVTARLLKALQRAGDDPEAVEDIGTQYAAAQCADLLHEGVAGLHFYTLNQSRATVAILRSLGYRPQTPTVS
ncbi:MAG: methylenetetrahydrofolate reductase [NAD(P)H] [Chthoniobacteraceae bacterium]